MNVSEIIIKLIGVALAVFGFFVLIGSVTGLPGTWITVLIGIGLIAVGIYIVRGGSFTI